MKRRKFLSKLIMALPLSVPLFWGWPKPARADAPKYQGLVQTPSGKLKMHYVNSLQGPDLTIEWEPRLQVWIARSVIHGKPYVLASRKPREEAFKILKQAWSNTLAGFNEHLVLL